MIKEIENKIGQLQYEISCLGLDKEELTGVSVRTEELKVLVKKLTIPVVVGRSEQLKCEHKGRRTATELVEYCEDCKKILYHP